MRQLLLVDDEWPYWSPLLREAARSHGWQTDAVASIEEGLEWLSLGETDVVLLDLAFPEGSTQGQEGLCQIRQQFPDLPVIILTAADTAADIRTAVECLKAGAWDYVTKSSLDVTHLLIEVDNAHRHAREVQRSRRLLGSFNEAVGESPFFAQYRSGEEHVCSFGVELNSIASAPFGTAAAEVASWQENQMAWQRRILTGLSAPGISREMELRYVIDPVFAPERVRILFLGRGFGPTAEDACGIATDLWVDLKSLLHINEVCYQFRALDTEEKLRNAARPFAFSQVVEIRRVCREVHPGEPSGAPMGFRRDTTPIRTKKPILLPAPIAPSGTTLAALLGLLLNQDAKLMVALLFRSGSLAPGSEIAARQQDGGEAGSRIAAIGGKPVRLSRAARRTLGRSELLEQSGPAEPEEPEQIQSQLPESLETRLLRLGAPEALEVRLMIGSTSEPTKALLNTVATELLVDSVSGYEVAQVLADGDRLAIQPWGLNPSGSDPNPLAVRYTPEEARLLLRLPIAGPGGAVGLASHRPQFSLLPERISQEGPLLGIKQTPRSTLQIRLALPDRSKHVYILGQTGTGKSTLLSAMILSDIREGRGLCVVDPHGDLVEGILGHIPPGRVNDVILLDPTDIERPLGLNLLKAKDEQEQDFLADQLIEILYKTFDPQHTGIIGPQFEQATRAGAHLIMQANKGWTVLELPRLFEDGAFLKEVLEQASPGPARDFFRDVWQKKADFHKSEFLGWLTSKFDRFRNTSMLRGIVGQPTSSFDLAEAMNEQRIVLVNLSKGRLGGLQANFLGSLVVSKLFAATLERSNVRVDLRTPFSLYMDEFQNFTTDTLTEMIAEVRKYGLSLIFAHQNLTQISDRMREAILGNVGSLVVFRVGLIDSERIAPQVTPYFNARDLADLPNWTAVTRLLVGGRRTLPFAFQTVVDETPGDMARAAQVRRASRNRYGRSLA